MGYHFNEFIVFVLILIDDWQQGILSSSSQLEFESSSEEAFFIMQLIYGS